MAGLPPYPPQGNNPYGFSNDPNQQQTPSPYGGLPQMPPVQVQQPPQGNGMGVAGMVLGIIALVLFWVPFLDGLMALLAIILSAAGMSRANKIGGRGKGMAIAGLVLGIIAMLLTIVFIAMWITAMHRVHSYSSYDYGRYNY